MKKIVSLLTAITVGAGLASAPAQPAKAGIDWNAALNPPVASRVYEIVENLPSSWDVLGGARFVDQYTTSRIRFVSKCSGRAYRCIKIYNLPVSGNQVAYTYGPVIRVDVAKANRSGKFRVASVRRWLIAHELGHEFGLSHSTGDNFMWPYNRRYGKYPKLYATSSQRAHLRRR